MPAKKNGIPAYNVQADIQRKQRDAVAARKAGNRMQASQISGQAKQLEEEEKKKQTAKVKQKVSGFSGGADMVAEARKARLAAQAKAKKK